MLFPNRSKIIFVAKLDEIMGLLPNEFIIDWGHLRWLSWPLPLDRITHILDREWDVFSLDNNETEPSTEQQARELEEG
jgi:hypothetical protein